MIEASVPTSKIHSFSESAKPVTTPLILDTLAQLRTCDPNRLLKRARSKYFTSSIAIGLADLKTPLEKYYWNAYHCCDRLLQQGATITGKYCNSRICNVCNRIRTAKAINGYAATLKLTIPNAQFVTLTRKNVTASALSETITKMCYDFRKILNANISKKRYGKSVTMDGIRKLEITYNVLQNTFHPHFHIVTGIESAEVLRSEWLKRNEGVTEKHAQDIRPVTDETLIELFKYATKVVTKGKRSVPFPALDVIMQSLHHRRIIQPFGAIRRVSEDVDELHSDIYPELPEYELMEWCWHEHDWINCYAECLTGYAPDVEKCNGTEN